MIFCSLDRERVHEQGVPEDDAPGGAEPDRVRVREIRVVADLLDAQRDVGEPELALVRLGRGDELCLLERPGDAEVEVGEGEGEERCDPDEDTGAG